MSIQELRDRSKRFALDVVRLCRGLPRDWHVRVIGQQLLRSGTSVAANHRACGRARSDKEFCAKMGVVVEEADESQLWLELLVVAAPSVSGREHQRMLQEANELTAIFSTSLRTAKDKLQAKKTTSKKKA
jgi:four helix bundle protein